jgi:hypothetical protein
LAICEKRPAKFNLNHAVYAFSLLCQEGKRTGIYSESGPRGVMPVISSLKEGSLHEKKVKPEKNGESNYNNSNNRCLGYVYLFT